ncbi:MAG: hypothetical protein ACXWP5_14770, partial [Bdellovibrionota bacterium]
GRLVSLPALADAPPPAANANGKPSDQPTMTWDYYIGASVEFGGSEKPHWSIVTHEQVGGLQDNGMLPEKPEAQGMEHYANGMVGIAHKLAEAVKADEELRANFREYIRNPEVKKSLTRMECKRNEAPALDVLMMPEIRKEILFLRGPTYFKYRSITRDPESVRNSLMLELGLGEDRRTAALFRDVEKAVGDQVHSKMSPEEYRLLIEVLIEAEKLTKQDLMEHSALEGPRYPAAKALEKILQFCSQDLSKKDRLRELFVKRGLMPSGFSPRAHDYFSYGCLDIDRKPPTADLRSDTRVKPNSGDGAIGNDSPADSEKTGQVAPGAQGGVVNKNR